MKFFADYINLVLIAIALISGALLAWPAFSRRGGKGLSTLEATQLINRKHAIVLDIRSSDEFNNGHLPQARNLSLDTLAEKVGQVAKNKTAPILLVCKNGHSSAKAQSVLRQLGYAETFSLQGGVDAWQQAGLPVVK